jgi:hypothetical protein
MKKFLIICGMLLMLFAGTATAKAMNGIGIYGNLVGNGTGTGGGLGLTLRYSTFPVLGLEWNFLPNSSILGGSLDWWVVSQQLGGIFYYYIGIGGYAAMTTVAPTSTFNFGGRVPLGLQVYPVDQLELFLEVSPMIVFLPVMDWTVSVRLGFRVLWE